MTMRRTIARVRVDKKSSQDKPDRDQIPEVFFVTRSTMIPCCFKTFLGNSYAPQILSIRSNLLKKTRHFIEHRSKTTENPKLLMLKLSKKVKADQSKVADAGARQD